MSHPTFSVAQGHKGFSYILQQSSPSGQHLLCCYGSHAALNLYKSSPVHITAYYHLARLWSSLLEPAEECVAVYP